MKISIFPLINSKNLQWKMKQRYLKQIGNKTKVKFFSFGEVHYHQNK